jgi:hypothetical protein
MDEWNLTCLTKIQQTNVLPVLATERQRNEGRNATPGTALIWRTPEKPIVDGREGEPLPRGGLLKLLMQHCFFARMAYEPFAFNLRHEWSMDALYHWLLTTATVQGVRADYCAACAMPHSAVSPTAQTVCAQPLRT